MKILETVDARAVSGGRACINWGGNPLRPDWMCFERPEPAILFRL